MGDKVTRRSGTAAIVLTGCLAGCLASGTVGAGVARAAAVHAGSPGLAAPGTATCDPSLDTYDRTQLCWRADATVAVVQGATRVGTLTFDLTHDMQLNPRSRDWAERITISAVQATGGAAGMTMTLHASCASPCSAADHFPQGRLITDGLTGVIDYADAVGAGRTDSERTVYQLSFVKPGDTPVGFTYQTPLSYRCDDALPGLPAGCVFPAYAPYLTTLTSLPAVADDIYAAQSGPGHYGRTGSGHPLHRVTSPATQAANYAAVCAPTVVGVPPAGQACDEYPFRSAREGGTAVSKASRVAAWVPAAQEKAKNSRIASFYDANRVLNGDPFWVVL
jgi:hypothetical protein